MDEKQDDASNNKKRQKQRRVHQWQQRQASHSGQSCWLEHEQKPADYDEREQEHRDSLEEGWCGWNLKGWCVGKLMEEKFDAVENCEEKLREVRILAGIAERFDGAQETALQNKRYGSRSRLHLRTWNPSATKPSVYEELRLVDGFFLAGFWC